MNLLEQYTPAELALKTIEDIKKKKEKRKRKKKQKRFYTICTK